MMSCDTNLLFHRCRPADPLFTSAAAFFASQQDNPHFVLCELALIELYTLLRNPAVTVKPLSANEAVAVIQQLRRHPRWRIVDYPGGLMPAVWQRAAQPGFGRRRIYDARMAIALQHHGVTEFATRNISDFKDLGFRRVWDPCAA